MLEDAPAFLGLIHVMMTDTILLRLARLNSPASRESPGATEPASFRICLYSVWGDPP